MRAIGSMCRGAARREYYLPAVKANKDLSYVGAVAYRDGQIVGVGELTNFKLEDDVVNQYDIELAAQAASWLLGLGRRSWLFRVDARSWGPLDDWRDVAE